MGYELLGSSRDLNLSETSVGKLFHLGQQHGWTPRGTDFNVAMGRQELQSSGVPDEQIDASLAAAAAGWSGSYSGNDCQVVTAVDAIAWAAALQRALPQLAEDREANLVREFISLCGDGAFCIA